MLKQLGIGFVVCQPRVEGRPLSSAIGTVLLNAQLKAWVVEKKFSSQFVIAVDIMVSLDDKILGKPRDFYEARKTLESLSNRWYEVLTAISINYL